MRRQPLAALIVTVSLLALGCGSQARQFKLDWQLNQGPGGPSVKGHIVNPYALPARDIRLLVEGLDESGQVTTKTLGYLPTIVPSGSEVSFDIPVAGNAARYRVKVLSYDWVLPAASGGRR